ncbi:MAG: c-type cytochrome [Pseudomonadota bacterium]
MYLRAAIAVLLGLAGAGSAQAQAVDGAALFRQRCAACHSTASDVRTPKPGPNLGGVVGRKAGGQQGFRYSPALAKSGIVWSPKTLDSYLSKPAGLVPGTSMMIATPKADQRAALIGYLAQLK